MCEAYGRVHSDICNFYNIQMWLKREKLTCYLLTDFTFISFYLFKSGLISWHNNTGSVTVISQLAWLKEVQLCAEVCAPHPLLCDIRLNYLTVYLQKQRSRILDWDVSCILLQDNKRQNLAKEKQIKI